MCGIAAYYGKGNAVQIVVNALKALSYRGYDSYGIAAVTEKDFFEKKDTGDISILEEQNFPNSGICIGHTRWATHGKVSKENSHPHFSCDKKIWVVHNGEIENFLELKEELSKKHEFVSETDTEVIPHLIEDFLKAGCTFKRAFQKTLLELRGKFAIVALNLGTKELLAAKNSPPLVMGFKEKEIFLASDVTGFLKHTNYAVFLEDFEMAAISEKAEFFDYRTMEGIEKKTLSLEWKVDEINKGFFKHFMLKEIFEQPNALESLINEYEKNNELVFPEKIIDSIKNSERIVLLGCGTSYFACQIAEQLFEQLALKQAKVEYASEFRYRQPIIKESDFFIAVSQSGETADTLAAIQLAKEKRARVLNLVNVKESSMERASDFVLHIKAGPEIAVASTKAFLSFVLLLTMLALRLKKERGESIEKEVLEMKNLPKKIQRILIKHAEIEALSKKFSNSSNALFLGRGLNYPIALEGALKLKEISYIHAEGYPAAEMKHGPIALIDENMPVFFIAVKDYSREKIISNIQEVIARKGKVIAICNENDSEIKKMADFVIEIPETMEIFYPLLSVVPLQLISYFIAEERGCEIDKPKNLAKSVTVE